MSGLPPGSDRQPGRAVLIQRVNRRGGYLQPSGEGRAGLHVLHCQCGQLTERQRRAHPPARRVVFLGRHLASVVVKISVQHPAGGQGFQQRLPVQPFPGRVARNRATRAAAR